MNDLDRLKLRYALIRHLLRHSGSSLERIIERLYPEENPEFLYMAHALIELELNEMVYWGLLKCFNLYYFVLNGPLVLDFGLNVKNKVGGIYDPDCIVKTSIDDFMNEYE